MKFILLLITLNVHRANCRMQLVNLTDLISDFIKHNNLKYVSFYTCFKQNENVKLNKFLCQLNIHSSFITNHYRTTVNNNYKVFDGRIGLSFIVDVSCKGYDRVLRMAEKHNLFRSQYKWLIFDTKDQMPKDRYTIIQIFNNVTLRTDSEITVVLFVNEASMFYDVYATGFNAIRQLKITAIGSINEHFLTSQKAKKAIFCYNRLKYERRKNMTGVVLRSAIINTHMADVNTTIHAYYTDLTKRNYDSMNKVQYALFMHMQDIHNFTLQLTLTNMWFGNLIGGMDAGMAKLLYEDKIDISASCGLIKTDRIPLFDFVSPTYPFRTCFIFRNPGTSGKLQNEFLKPFVSTVWFYILGYIILFCVILKCSFFAEKLLFDSMEENSWVSAYLLTWAVFCQQGATFIPKPTSGRCIVLSLLTMSLLLYNYYTSSIVSSLLSGLPSPFKTIEELTESNFEVGIEDVVYMRTLFEVSNDSRIKRLYKHKVLGRNNQPSYVKLDEGIHNVKTGGYAYHTEPTNGYQIIERTFEPYEICELAEINVFQPTVLWIYSQKHSQYTKLFAVGYLKMLESGIIPRQQKIWVTTKPACLAANTHLVEVGIQHLLPAFVILLVGLIISVILLILEIIAKTYYPKFGYTFTKHKK